MGIFGDNTDSSNTSLWIVTGILFFLTIIILAVTLRRRKKAGIGSPVGSEEPVVISDEIRYATLWERFLAVFTDSLILLPLSVPSYFLYYWDSDYFALSIVLATIAEVVYYVYLEYTRGQTLGKKVMKIKVIADGGDLTLNRVSIRNIYRFAGLLELTVAGFLTLIWTVVAATSIASSPKKQRPLDMLAGTVVIKVS